MLPVEKEEINNKYKNKGLIFACKKYVKCQQNGILVLFLENNMNDINIKDCYFYNTKDFEVYCFCQILLIIQNLS